MTKRIISAIQVTPVTFYAGAPVGTPIATVAVLISSGSFSGTLNITGPNKADFQAPVLNPDGTYTLKSAIVIPATWSPWINLVAWWNAVANSPYTAGPYSFAASVAPSPPPPPPPPPPLSPVVVTLARQYEPYPGFPLGDFPPNVAPGTKVATITATRSDGQPFTGTIFFAPNGDYGGAYALTMNPDFTANLIVNPAGPGVGSVNIQEHVQIEANQP